MLVSGSSVGQNWLFGHSDDSQPVNPPSSFPSVAVAPSADASAFGVVFFFSFCFLSNLYITPTQARRMRTTGATHTNPYGDCGTADSELLVVISKAEADIVTGGELGRRDGCSEDDGEDVGVAVGGGL